MNNIIYVLLIPMLTFISIVAIGASVIISRNQKKMIAAVRLRNDILLDIPAEEKTKKFKFIQILAKIGNLVSHGNTKKDLNEQLMRVGYLSSAAPAVYTGIKISLLVIGLGAMTFFLAPLKISASTKFILIILGASVLSFIPNVAVAMKLKKRHHEIRRHLPAAMDLLEICVSSGIGLDMAWSIVSDEIKQVSPILADAMSLTNFEINLGASRTEAMHHMADRTGAEELSSFAAILIQSERFGTSIADVLKVYADSVREQIRSQAEELAEKMAVKLIFPMVLFMFPAILIVLAGPAFISLSKTLAAN